MGNTDVYMIAAGNETKKMVLLYKKSQNIG